MKRLFVLAIALSALAPAQRGAAFNPPAAPPAPQQPVAPQPPAEEPGRYMGLATCAASGCHGSTQALNTTHVLQNEYLTWLNSDRHAQADNVLYSDRSARIARNMRLAKKAYQEKICLDCHSTNLPAQLISGRIDLTDGVQCEACHGPASGWRAEHAQPGWTHEQSVARGMIDLRDVAVRAHTCNRCHVGADDREVDHELIASGHPILPFELDNYTETMPPHWAPGKPTHGVRAWATGQAMEFRDSLHNLARHARGEKWPEFSDMSCYNCHHALKTSGWRQERGWPGRAGLPAWSPQHWAALRFVVARVSPGARDELDAQVRQLADRVSRMNDPRAVAESADETAKTIEPLIAKIDALSWSDGDVRSLMRTIADDANVPDVHSAEQVALSLQSLATSLTRRNPKQLKGPMMQSIDALFADLQDRDNYEPSRFAAKLRAVAP